MKDSHKTRYTDLEIKEKRMKMKQCEHEFIIVKKFDFNDEGRYWYDDDIIECVHCGLSNKYIPFERLLLADSKINRTPKPKLSVESEEFNLIYPDRFQYGNNAILFSNIIIDSKHISLLYQIACFIKSDASANEIAEIMFKLNLLETKEERKYLSNIKDAENLIKRYYSFMLDTIKYRSRSIPKLIRKENTNTKDEVRENPKFCIRQMDTLYEVKGCFPTTKSYKVLAVPYSREHAFVMSRDESTSCANKEILAKIQSMSQEFRQNNLSAPRLIRK